MTFTAEGDKMETIDDFIQALRTGRVKVLTIGESQFYLTKLKVNFLIHFKIIKFIV